MKTEMTEMPAKTNMYLKIQAHKSPEREVYYCDLPDGKRLILREGKIEGIYDPNLSEVLE